MTRDISIILPAKNEAHALKVLLPVLRRSFPDDEIIQCFVDLFRDARFFGAVMVELKEQDGQYYMIEANPRLWGPSQLMLDAGCNLLTSYVEEYFDPEMAKTVEQYKVGVPYFWSMGFFEALFSSRGIQWFEGGKREFLRKLWRLVAHEVYFRPGSFRLFFNSD